MDKKTFISLYNKGSYNEIIGEYCLEKGKTLYETSIFLNLIEWTSLYKDCVEYICNDISKTEPITFLYDKDNNLIKIF